MKRFNFLLLGVVLVLTLTGCNNINSDISSDLEENSTAVSGVENNDEGSVSLDAPISDDTEESTMRHFDKLSFLKCYLIQTRL